MRGTTTASLSGGSFSVSNGSLMCGGDENDLDISLTISIPVLCSDGRKGIITATRDNSGMSGGGHFTLSDGTTGDFIFGPAAGKLRTGLRVTSTCGYSVIEIAISPAAYDTTARHVG